MRKREREGPKEGKGSTRGACESVRISGTGESEEERRTARVKLPHLPRHNDRHHSKRHSHHRHPIPDNQTSQSPPPVHIDLHLDLPVRSAGGASRIKEEPELRPPPCRGRGRRSGRGREVWTARVGVERGGVDGGEDFSFEEREVRGGGGGLDDEGGEEGLVG